MNRSASAQSVLLRRLAWAGFLLMLLVTTSSAYLRLRAAGLGCEDWPSCYGQHRVDAAALPSTWLAGARVAHRLSASAAGAVALLIVVLAFARRQRDPQALAAGVALVLLAAMLAYLGRATPQARVAAVAMGNLLGGMSMSALFLFLAVRRGGNELPSSTATTATLLLAVLMTLLQLAYGAMTSASYSGLACTTFPDCAGAWWPADAAWSAFDPWRAVAAEASSANMTLHMMHRYGGVLLGVVLLMLGIRLMRCGARLSGILLTTLIVLQWATGIAMVRASLPVTLALLHNVLAGLLLVTLAAVIGAHIRPREAG